MSADAMNCVPTLWLRIAFQFVSCYELFQCVQMFSLLQADGNKFLMTVTFNPYEKRLRQFLTQPLLSFVMF